MKKTLISLALTFMLLPLVPVFSQEAAPQLAPEDVGLEMMDDETVRITDAPQTTIEAIKILPFQLVPAKSRKLDFKDVLSGLQNEHISVLLGDEKIKLAKAREKGLKNNKILLFFKFFKAADLENSVENDVEAARFFRESASQEAMLTGSKKYYALMKAAMGRYVAYQAIQQGLKQLALNENNFKTGKSTSFEVLQTKTQLLQRYQDYMNVNLKYQQASLDLAQFIGMDPHQLIYPGSLNVGKAGYEVESLQLVPLNAELSDIIKVGSQLRPDLQELNHRHLAFEHMAKANSSDFDPTEKAVLKIQLKQIELQQQQAGRLAEAAMTNAYYELHGRVEEVLLAEEQLKLAEKALRQVQVSHNAGLSSNKDVLDTQVAYAQAQVNYANQQINANTSQLQLLYEVGMIDKETIAENELIDFHSLLDELDDDSEEADD